MSLHYLLDGYNIIHQLAKFRFPEGTDERDGLLRLMTLYRPQGSVKNKLTVVFDGGTSDVQRFRQYAGMEVIFSLHQSADERIREIVERSTQKKGIIVVTNDRAIQYAVKALGAGVNSVEEFLSRMRPFQNKMKAKNIHQEERAGTKNISTSLEFKITSELADIWLKKSKS